jgi:splicing factor 3B subunit 2
VPEEVVLDTNFAEFTRIFDRFKFTSNQGSKSEADEEAAAAAKKASLSATGKAGELERFKARIFEDEEEEEREKKEQGETEKAKLSKKKLKQQTRLSVAALKQLVQRPDVVEMHDVTAADPKMLVYLKSIRNSVQVPRHWSAKRKYLQGKRGFEKPAFDLPDFIKRTGIQSMREAVQEKDKNKSLKQKMREKVRPKTGRVDIDYQKLHDAFFRWQTKPRMTIHGDLYYEGKELETRLKEKKPGNMTDDLRIALGMPTGPNADKVPPPWLIAMQRYGPPPSYPSLKIPGLNAPIPEVLAYIVVNHY